MARLLITGAAGFIGRALCRELAVRGHTVLGLTRNPAAPIPNVALQAVGTIGPATDWAQYLDGAEIIIHLANRAHRSPRNTDAAEPEAAAALARAAAKAGVRRFVQVSSLRAMGEESPPGAPFRPGDPALPREAYGRAKLAIEHALHAAARETSLDLVILRPPLVYGPGVRGNFRALLELVARGMPLPLAGINNQRSLIFLDNFVDLLCSAGLDPRAAGCVLLARDGLDFSTPELIGALAAGMGRRARLYALPRPAISMLRLVPVVAPVIDRLTLSLRADDTKTRSTLDWQPPISPEIGLARTVKAFRDER